jgi:hypothetical protein
LLPDETVAMPPEKEMAVADPKSIAVPLLFFTVGEVTGFDDEFAPLKVRLLEPAYVKSVLPYGSSAVMVRFCGEPAVWVGEPVMTSLLADAALTCRLELAFPYAPPSVAVIVVVSALVRVVARVVVD